MAVEARELTDWVSPAKRRAANRLGIVLLVCAEAMFFIAMIGAFLVLRSGEPGVFAASAAVLNRALGAAGVGCLAAASLAIAGAATMARGRMLLLLLACAAAAGFLIVTATQANGLLRRHTVIAGAGDPVRQVLYDGQERSAGSGEITLIGTRRMGMPGESLDAHRVIATDPTAGMQSFSIPLAAVQQDVSYGPGKNNFLGIFFVLETALAAHVVAAVLITAVLTARRTKPGGSAIQAIQPWTNYWHFATAAAVAIYLLFYLRR